MKAVITNPPWIVNQNGTKRYGVRATSRWPHLRNDKILPFPIYHAYAAAIMEQAKIQVKAIDAVDKEMSLSEFVEEINKFDPEYVFIETSFSSYEFDKRSIKAVKENTKAKTVLFGTDASARAEDIMKECKEVDYIAYGEYDYTLKDIVLSKDIKKVDGVYYREKNKIKKTKIRALIDDLDTLPFPARHLYSKESYQEPLCHKPQFFVITSRGCPFGCSFCLYPQTISGRRFRIRSVKSVVDEMEYLTKKLGAKTINIDDDTFTVNTKRVKEICQEILKRKLKVKWQCFSSVNIQDKEMYALMSKSGCEMVKFGVESANLATQKNVGKNLDIEKIKKGFKMAEDVGLRTFGTFMFGLPGDTKESMEDTIKLAMELNPFAVQFSFAVAFPGTGLYSQAKQNGWLIKENHNGFAGYFEPSILPYGLKEGEVKRKVQDAYRRFYLRPNYLAMMILSTRNINDIKRLSWGMNTLMKRLLLK